MKYANGVDLIFTGAGPGFEGVPQGITFEGTDGWVWVHCGSLDAELKSLRKELIGPDETRLPVSIFHQANFLECVRSRQKTISHIDVAVISMSPCVPIRSVSGPAVRYNCSASYTGIRTTRYSSTMPRPMRR